MEIIEKILVPELYLPIIYILVAFAVNLIINNIIDKMFSVRENKVKKESFAYKKLKTFKTIVKNIVKYIIVIILLIAILTVFKVDVTSILAGLGIVGVLVGLALQDLAKDLIAGFSIIFENHYAIGDTIKVGDFKGEVIYIGLKTTKIRAFTGEVKIISNHNITEVINYNLATSFALIDIDVSYLDDTDKVFNVLNSLALELSDTLPYLKGNVQVLGIEDLASSSVKYRVMVETLSMKHLEVQRLMRKEIKDRFKKEKISIPYTQIDIHTN